MRFVLPQDSTEAASEVLFLRVPTGLRLASEEIPLRFVEADGHVEILAPQRSPPRWAGALDRQSAVSWRIGERQAHGVAETVEDPQDVAAILQRFEARFGHVEVQRWFGTAVLGFRLVERLSAPADYHAQVADYFDRLAARYDGLVETNPLDRHLRFVSGAVLAHAFRQGDRVLEIGSGTGLETLPLARRGVYVVATDLSAAMLTRLADKAREEGISSNIETRQVSARDLERVLEEFGPASFDGAFSDFGALNCEPDLERLPETLHALLRPNAPLVLGVWNRYCMADALLSVVARKPRRAFARLHGPVAVGQSRYGIPVYARGPGEMLGAFRPHFELVHLTGLPVFAPPYDFAGSLPAHGALLPFLFRLDARLAGKFPFNRVGDHFLAELRRRP